MTPLTSVAVVPTISASSRMRLAHVALLALDFPEEGHEGAAAPIGRVAREDLGELLLLVGEEWRLGVSMGLVHRLTYLSTSPSTGSKLAMLMTMSAKSPPMLEGSSDWRLARLGALTLTR